VILEEMRSENRATLEAVLAFRSALEARLDRVDQESRGRDETLSLAISDIQGQLRLHSSDLTELKRLSLRHGADIAELKEMGLRHSAGIAEHGADIGELKLGLRENTIELRSLSQKVDALNRLEDRVAALEKRAVGPEGGSTPSPL
jgi:hypothetical protein